MDNSSSGHSTPNESGAKTAKSSSIAGVVYSLRRFASMENLSGRAAKGGTMAQRRFPVVPNNTERQSPRFTPLNVIEENYSQSSRASGIASVAGLPNNMRTSTALFDHCTHCGSTGTILTGEGRPAMRRARSTLSLFPALEETSAPEFPEVEAIQPPPKAKVAETKSEASAIKVIDFADFTPSASVTTLAPEVDVKKADVKTAEPSTTPAAPPKVLTNHKNSSTLSLSKPSTVNKITDFITMQPNNPPAATVELTPLSGLIVQSRRDIQTLKAIHARTQVPPPPVNNPAAAIPAPAPARGLVGTGKRMLKSTWSSIGNLRKAFQDSSESVAAPVTQETEMTEPKKEVDYDKMERNLDRFDDLYTAFLELTNADGEQNEEIHLIAVVSKKGEMVRGVRQAGGISITEKVVAPPPAPPVADCGM